MNKLPDGEASFNHLFSSYKINAENRRLLFSLSKKFFKRLTKKPCRYCGTDPCQVFFQHNRKGKSSTPYTYNGIDRVNSNKGYVVGNVVPCCFVCNNAKRSLSLREFNAWIDRLIKFKSRR